MSAWLNGFARAPAREMPRRWALRILLAAAVGGALSGLPPKIASAVTCTGSEVLCKCPSINGLFYELCCPDNTYTCTCFPPPGGAAVCSPPTCPADRQCGGICCEVGGTCANADIEYCCAAGESKCTGGNTVSCCKPGEECAASTGTCCPAGQEVCLGEECCAPGQVCTFGGQCCAPEQVCGTPSQCCPPNNQCKEGVCKCPKAKRCGSNCCAPDERCHRQKKKGVVTRVCKPRKTAKKG